MINAIEARQALLKNITGEESPNPEVKKWLEQLDTQVLEAITNGVSHTDVELVDRTESRDNFETLQSLLKEMKYRLSRS